MLEKVLLVVSVLWKVSSEARQIELEYCYYFYCYYCCYDVINPGVTVVVAMELCRKELHSKMLSVMATRKQC